MATGRLCCARPCWWRITTRTISVSLCCCGSFWASGSDDLRWAGHCPVPPGLALSFPLYASHDEIRLVGKIRTEARINRASRWFVHFKVIKERIGRLSVVGRDKAAELPVTLL